MRREQKVHFTLVRADELRYECGYYEPYDDEEETFLDGCKHPENEVSGRYASCCAAACPLGPLAGKFDFRQAGRMIDYEEGAFVLLYKDKRNEVEKQERREVSVQSGL